MMTIWYRPTAGWRAASCTSARISFTPMERPSGTTSRMSVCVPVIAVWHDGHSPHPRTPATVGHCRAAANARAATDRPEPGGPVNSHACVIADGSSAAVASSATASAWPTTSSQTPVMIAADGAGTARCGSAPDVAILLSSTTAVVALPPAGSDIGGVNSSGRARCVTPAVSTAGGIVASRRSSSGDGAGSTGVSAASTRPATSSGVPSASTTT